MKKLYKRIITVFLSSILICLSVPCLQLIAFAADGISSKTVSHGMIIFIMVTVFIVTAAATAYISFRLTAKKNKNQNKTDDK